MKAKVYPLTNINTEVLVPASPFCLQLEIICATLASGTSVISNITRSKDIEDTIRWCKQIGAQIKVLEGKITVKGIGGEINLSNALFTCENSSSTAKLMIPLICREKQPFGIKASKEVIDELASYSYLYDQYKILYYVEDEMIRFENKIVPLDIEVDGDIDIYVSAGLFVILPLLDKASTFRLRAPVRNEKTYQTITKVMRNFGVDVKHPSSMKYEINGNQNYKKAKVETEQDSFALSHIALLTQALKGKQELRLFGYQMSQTLAEKYLLDFIKKHVVDYKNYLFKRVFRKKEFSFVKLEATLDNSLPLLMVLAVLNNKDSIITKVDFNKERVVKQYNIMKKVFTKLGINCVEYESEITLKPSKVNKKQQVDCKGDPYVALAITFLALLSEVPIIIRNVSCVYNIYLDAFNVIKDLGAKIEFIHD